MLSRYPLSNLRPRRNQTAKGVIHMIVTRTPFRIPLGGGGTDLPSYYEKHGGFIFSVAINKYMYIAINRPVVDDLIRVKYSLSETVDSLDSLKHDIARESLRLTGITKGIEITSMADAPAGTGLGSSSCYAVGLLNALRTMKRDYVSLQGLAEEACRIEIEILKKPIGKQDQYLAAFGGLTVMEIGKNGNVLVRPARIEASVSDDLRHNLMLFYTNTSRSADKILAEQSSGAKEEKKNVLDNMHYIKELGLNLLESLESGNLTEVGLTFDKHWNYKRKISSQMSNPRLDRIYEIAKTNGAIGGKVIGAGGGGFFLFYTEGRQKDLRNCMRSEGLTEMPFEFDHEGSKVLFNIMAARDLTLES